MFRHTHSVCTTYHSARGCSSGEWPSLADTPPRTVHSVINLQLRRMFTYELVSPLRFRRAHTTLRTTRFREVDAASVGATSLPHAYSSAVRVAPLWRHCCNTKRLNTRKGFNTRQLCSGPTDSTLLHDSKSRQKTWRLRALLQTCGDQQTDEHWKLYSSKHTSVSVFNMSIESIRLPPLSFWRIFIFLEYFCLILRIPATVIKFLS